MQGGFHKEFKRYYEHGKGAGAPCVGDFCKMRPKFDDTLLARVEHVPVPAGAAVFWDQRLPHGNARFQFKNTPRMVLYGSWLPAVPVNEKYNEEQERRKALGIPPGKEVFWMK